MGTRNQNLELADIAIAQLDTNGGLLEPDQANAFIDMIMEEPTILPQARVIRMPAPEVKINRLGFGSRVLKAARTTGSANDDGSNDRYLLKADRSAPTTAQIQLTSSEVMAEVRIPYEVLEDNIEGQSMEAHIMRLLAKQAALDLEEFALWADTGSGDAFLALQNGWLKRSTAHVADNLGEGVNPDLFANALLALPQKYLRYLDQMRGFISVANTIRYRQKVAQRQTGYGDAALQNAIPLSAHGLKLEGTPMLAADNLGATGLVTFPKNLIFGIRRDITVETDKDIRSREYIIVLTLRTGLQVDDADAIVKLEDI
jgi:HK97 family phage major capsid protein